MIKMCRIDEKSSEKRREENVRRIGKWRQEKARDC
jgi:hypothetical protein